MWRDPHLAKEKKATKRAVWAEVGGKREVDKIWKRRGGGVSNIWGVLIKFYSSPNKELIKTQKIKKPSGEASLFTILGFIIFLSYDLENCKSYDWREKESRWAWGINIYLKYF